MRIVRFSFEGKVKYGILENDFIRGLARTPFRYFKGPSSPFDLDGTSFDPAAVKLLAPCVPSKIVAIGLNYRSHSEEVKIALPRVPLIFLKPSTAVIGPAEPIILPRGSGRVDYEGELGVVIGRRAKDVPAASSSEYILGYTCVNDVSERHIQKEDVQWTRAKGFDTFAPIGPWIETQVDPSNLKIETRLNGELRQSARTADLIFNVPTLVEFISGVLTLLPGDIISTGTPSGIGRINPGDAVEITIEGIGTLRNPVASQRTPANRSI